MSAYDLSDRMAKIHRAIEAVTELKLMEGVHGLDRELLAEELTELHLAAHDTCREFEAECVRQGEWRAKEILRANVNGQKGDALAAEVASFLSR